VLYVEIKRSFSPFSGKGDGDEDFEYWARLATSRRDRRDWKGLLEKRLVVVLGEARSGKTEEFRQQARRLQDEDKSAFFIRLDELAQGDFGSCLDLNLEALQRWLAGSETGYFFLDSVDEARLLSSAALRVSLGKVCYLLAPAAARSHVVISSRISDWMSQSVRQVLARFNTAMEDAVKATEARAVDNLNERVLEGRTIGEAIAIQRPAHASATTAQVDPPAYQIDALEPQDAMAIARGNAVSDPEALWAAIETGGYEDYAKRPGDLEWLVRRWKERANLGDLSELIQDAIADRLQEKNEAYIEHGVVLAPERLRVATRALAAASVLTGRPQLGVGSEAENPAVIRATDVLGNMPPHEIQRVLSSAVFDSPSLGRVRFHTRTIREYLAAEWVNSEMDRGLPDERAIDLFIAMPFGQRVLVRSRRGTLCWLATRNTRIREYVIRYFPEMVMFEGDVAQWAQVEVVEAFQSYLQMIDRGFWPDWRNDDAEYTRVARALPASVLNEAVRRYCASPAVLAKLAAVITHGALRDCAAQVFSVYRDQTMPRRSRNLALSTLVKIATPEHRAAIKADLLSGVIDNNDTRGTAFLAVGLEGFTDGELVAVLKSVDPAPELSGDYFVDAIRHVLLPTLGHDPALRLLRSVHGALPAFKKNELGSAYGQERKSFAWLLEMYVRVLKRVVATLPRTAVPTQELVDLVTFAERLNHTGFLVPDDVRKLRAGIAANVLLRKGVALRLGLEASAAEFSPLTGWAGLVQLDKDDRDWVVSEAMREAAPAAERQVWFLAAIDVVSRSFDGGARQSALQSLATGPDATVRKEKLRVLQGRESVGAKQVAEFAEIEREREEKQKATRTNWIKALTVLIPAIRAGTHVGALVELIQSARRHGDEFENIDPTHVIAEAGEELADAFTHGLATAFRVIDPPDPVADIGGNTLPWAGLVGMASANYAFREGLDAANATEADAVRAMRFAVWSLQDAAPWVAEASQRYPSAIAANLLPAFEAELKSMSADHFAHVYPLAFKTAQPLRGMFLDRSMQLLAEGKIPSAEMQRKLCAELTDHPGAATVIARYAQKQVRKAVFSSPATIPMMWLSEWLRHDIAGAWAWLREHAAGRFADERSFALAVAAEAANFEAWAKGMEGTPSNVEAVMEMFRFIEMFSPLEEAGAFAKDPAEHFVYQVPGLLRNMNSPASHGALRTLATDHGGTTTGHWLGGIADEVAAAHAELMARIEPRDIRTLHDVFVRDARTEAELLEQVVAALKQVRAKIETGVFSDRALFHPGIEEKQLQTYLAARIEDVAKHFRIVREPEVGLKNKPDIQAVAPAGMVPIEIKPVDSETHRYSANALAGTLRDQIAFKYFKHGGSRHGALVVMKLDDKAWEIPGGTQRGTFADLIAYLETEAETLRATTDYVSRIVVIGIDFTTPTRDVGS
jgi:hypothetical protein